VTVVTFVHFFINYSEGILGVWRALYWTLTV